VKPDSRLRQLVDYHVVPLITFAIIMALVTLLLLVAVVAVVVIEFGRWCRKKIMKIARGFTS